MSDLLRGSERRQHHILVGTGAAIVALAVLAAVILRCLPERTPPGTIHLTISTRDLGQGVNTGSKVVLRGVVVGQVDAVTTRADGVDVGIRLQRSQIEGLNDAFGFDYRPLNYFGISDVNLLPRPDGQPLTDGQHIVRAADGDYTMATMLTRSSTLVNGVVTDRMIDLVRRATDYTTALAPLVETGFLLTNAVAETQRRMPSEQLRDLNAILEPLPRFVDSAITAESALWKVPSAHEVIDNFGPMNETMQLIATGFFGPLGALLGSHAGDFGPLTEIVHVLAQGVSSSLAKAHGGIPLQTLLAGLDSAYTGPDGDKALKLRLVLDDLPVLASALPIPMRGDR